MDVQFYVENYMFLYIYVNYLSQNVFSHVHNVQYKRTFGKINKNDILCGVQKNENRIVAVKMVQSDENNICVGLERDWLLNKAFETGYDYIEKSKVLDIFNPPIELHTSQTSFHWIFPASFDVGAELTVSITVPTTFPAFVMNIFDTVKEDLQISPDVSEIVILHLIVDKAENFLMANRFIPSSGWGNEMRKPCPNSNAGLYVVTFESHTDFIKVIVNGESMLNYPNLYQPKEAAVLQIGYAQADPSFVESVTMTGPA